MNLDNMIDRWALWIITGGVVSAAEYSRLVGGESIQTTGPKPKPGPLVDNDREQAFHKLIIQSLNGTERRVIAHAYGIVPINPNMDRATLCGLSGASYRTILSRARKILSEKSGLAR